MADAPPKASDWSERHFQLKVENAWEHNAREIAEALAACQEETGAGPAGGPPFGAEGHRRTQAWPARADDALVRAAVVTNTPVLSLTPVLGDAGEEVAPGGMGALLRWR